MLWDQLNRWVFIYLDDMLIFSRNLEKHTTHVQTALQHLLQHSLFVKSEKCQFHAESVSFRGLIIGIENIQMDPPKVSPVTSWPVLEAAATFPGVCEFLPSIHPEIQLSSILPVPPHIDSGSLAMDCSCRRSLPDLERQVHQSHNPPGSVCVCGRLICGGQGHGVAADGCTPEAPLMDLHVWPSLIS